MNKFIKLTLSLFVLFLGIQYIYPKRVISLSPSITEIIYELGRGEDIVGNTKYCNYPPNAANIERIGGFLDLNLEKIIELKPDLIFFYPEHFSRISKLNQIAKLVRISHTNIDDLLNSIITISNELGIKNRGLKVTERIRSDLKKIRAQTATLQKKKVLIIIGRDPDKLRNITIIGKGDFLNEIIRISGGLNAYEGDISYPSVSMESIVKMDPEIIIEFIFSENPPQKTEILILWNKFPFINAVRSGNIYTIREDYWVRPGPRISKIAESLFEMLKK